MKLQYFGSINPVLSRVLYWLAGICTVIDGLCVIASFGYWYPGLSQKSTRIRVWCMKRKNRKIEMQQNKVACDIYTKEKRRGYLK